MKMFFPRLILLNLILFTGWETFGQINSESLVLAEFSIIKVEEDNEDVSEDFLDAGAYSVIYFNTDKEQIEFANVWPRPKTQSYGRVENLRYEDYPGEDGYPPISVFDFHWFYMNSYDDAFGISFVKMIKIFEEDETFTVIKITTDQDYVLEIYTIMEEGVSNEFIEEIMDMGIVDKDNSLMVSLLELIRM